MRCSGCGAENPDGARFCSSCGTPLRIPCPKCGELNRPGSKFCNDCGSALAIKTVEPRSSERQFWGRRRCRTRHPQFAPEGERKLVTALFVDIINSTGLEQDLDPEEARAIIDPALKLMIEAVRRYDGHVVQSTGDGIFALFGAPIAHEDHPQRSLYTALEIAGRHSPTSATGCVPRVDRQFGSGREQIPAKSSFVRSGPAICKRNTRQLATP